MSRGLIGLMGAIGVVAAVGVVAAIRDQDPQTSPSVRASAVSTTPRKQPPGPAPAGKVWSVEHGHWHDQTPKAAGSSNGGNGSPVQVQTASVPIPKKPQPPGPVPAGKVWSAEHGHWHDVRK